MISENPNSKISHQAIIAVMNSFQNEFNFLLCVLGDLCGISFQSKKQPQSLGWDLISSDG
jgi:hypothetical protein